MTDDELHDAFDAIVADLDDLDAPRDRVETPVMDALLDWSVHQGRIEVPRCLIEALLLVDVIDAVLTTGSWDPGTLAATDGDPDDPMAATVLWHHDELVTSTDAALTAASDLITGGIPLDACFDAARGLQHLRVVLCSTVGADGEPHDGQDDDEEPGSDAGDARRTRFDNAELAGHLADLAGALAEDLLALALDARP